MNESQFPNLNPANHSITSPETPEYNCIAWAAGDTEAWWEPHPDYYWPMQAPREYTLEAYKKAYETVNFVECTNSRYEDGYEKVAIYINSYGKPTHAARQLISGHWTSKLGQNVDIEHETLQVLEGPMYGKIAVIMKRLIF